jgi:hypothetical protein
VSRAFNILNRISNVILTVNEVLGCLTCNNKKKTQLITKLKDLSSRRVDVVCSMFSSNTRFTFNLNCICISVIFVGGLLVVNEKKVNSRNTVRPH